MDYGPANAHISYGAGAFRSVPFLDHLPIPPTTPRARPNQTSGTDSQVRAALCEWSIRGSYVVLLCRADRVFLSLGSPETQRSASTRLGALGTMGDVTEALRSASDNVSQFQAFRGSWNRGRLLLLFSLTCSAGIGFGQDGKRPCSE